MFVQVEYADILKNVDPLRRELSSLESDAEDTRMQGEEVEKVISELERSIAQYKEDYARLISEANAIKTDLEKVETKVLYYELACMSCLYVSLGAKCKMFGCCVCRLLAARPC